MLACHISHELQGMHISLLFSPINEHGNKTKKRASIIKVTGGF